MGLVVVMDRAIRDGVRCSSLLG
uniref:Uncharacterized protein n=1 Tax=Arundo donax TaxID=35708 RepID=A0A0A8Y7P0_ARUDO